MALALQTLSLRASALSRNQWQEPSAADISSSACGLRDLAAKRPVLRSEGNPLQESSRVRQDLERTSSSPASSVASSRISPAGCLKGEWSVRDSAALYGIDGWGSNYFRVNDVGHVTVRPNGEAEGEVDLVKLIEELESSGSVQLPFIARFPEIIGHRIKILQGCFDAAISRYNYKGYYKGVFPVKCNRDWTILQSVVKYGAPYSFGLEAGSKPELLVAMAALLKSPEALLVCNGYKDRPYVEIALHARRLGVNTVLVLEQMEEIDLVIKASRSLGVRPAIGVRAKLSTRAHGHWEDTSGDRGKFGLTATQLLQVVSKLRQAGMLDCLQLLHFHFGSQISDISVIKEAMREGSHLYAELCLLGAQMGHIDVGGGLGIDYDGTRSASGASLNYTVQNYANDVVAAVMDACRLKGVPHPVITSESGRALASYQSVLVFNVRNVTCFSEQDVVQHLSQFANTVVAADSTCIKSDDAIVPVHHPAEDLGEGNGIWAHTASEQQSSVGEYLLSTFEEVYHSMDGGNYQEAYNDAKQFKAEAASLFKLGCLSLGQRAHADALYLAICHRVLTIHEPNGTTSGVASSELAELQQSLASIYHCNLSIFQSIPDSWAIQQLFPIMPLSRLQEEPTEEATLADLTCDSDGKIARFISKEGTPATTLRLHKLQQDMPYYLGLFLGGVYQEAMGNSHNLFGAVATVYVNTKGTSGGESAPSVAQSSAEQDPEKSHPCQTVHSTGTPHLVRPGQSIEQVLRSSEIDAQSVLQGAIDEASQRGLLSGAVESDLRRSLVDSFRSYTYLSD